MRTDLIHTYKNLCAKDVEEIDVQKYITYTADCEDYWPVSKTL